MLVSVEGIEPPPHAPKARMIPFHYTEKTGAGDRDRTCDEQLGRLTLYH
jgi:hypothetical protein